MSSDGKIFNCEILGNNLKEIIRQSNKDSIKVNKLENPQISRIGENLYHQRLYCNRKKNTKQWHVKKKRKLVGKEKEMTRTVAKEDTLKKGWSGK